LLHLGVPDPNLPVALRLCLAVSVLNLNC